VADVEEEAIAVRGFIVGSGHAIRAWLRARGVAEPVEKREGMGQKERP